MHTHLRVRRARAQTLTRGSARRGERRKLCRGCASHREGGAHTRPATQRANGQKNGTRNFENRVATGTAGMAHSQHAAHIRRKACRERGHSQTGRKACMAGVRPPQRTPAPQTQTNTRAWGRHAEPAAQQTGTQNAHSNMHTVPDRKRAAPGAQERQNEVRPAPGNWSEQPCSWKPPALGGSARETESAERAQHRVHNGHSVHNRKWGVRRRTPRQR